MKWPDQTMGVKSSNVESVAHDPATNTLFVQYRNGGRYTYNGVDAEKFEQLRTADSVGSFLHSQIKMSPNHIGEKFKDDAEDQAGA